MATASTVEAGHEGAKVGMPQLDFSTFPNQIFWFLFALVVLYFIISWVALPRIGDILAARSGIISKDLADAAALKERAVQSEAAYSAALVAARSNAQRIGAETKADIQILLDAETAKADAEIAVHVTQSEGHIRAIRDGALASIETVAKDTAKAIVAAIMPSAADDNALDSAVNALLKG